MHESPRFSFYIVFWKDPSTSAVQRSLEVRAGRYRRRSRWRSRADVSHRVKVVGVHGEEGQEEDEEVRVEAKGEINLFRDNRTCV